MDIRDILDTARQYDASDVHIVFGLPPAFRVDGDIVLAETDPFSREDAAELTFSLLTGEQRAEFERELEISVAFEEPQLGRLRVTAYYHTGVPELAIRMCPASMPSAAELGLPDIVHDLARRHKGLVIITGPTGVGKTTTLNYMIDRINGERRCKIVTIEDPIEFVHQHKQAIVVQQEVRSDTHSFSRALVHALRQDPDVICVAEIRDQETISTALTAAETGHLVLTTLHTPSVVQTVERMIGVFPPQQQEQVTIQLASCLLGVVAQELLPGADGGRVLATEVLIATPAARRLIRDNECHKLASVIETGQQFGMHTMDMCLRDLINSGRITRAAARTRSQRSNVF